MFGWLTNCWGGKNPTTEFERGRIACTHGDWTIPEQYSLAIVIGTLKGQNPQTDNETAFNSLITHFEEDQDKSNAAFILKNLLILDLIVEERLFLMKISHYQNTRLLYLQSNSLQISSSVKDLIASFYVYITEKAKIYADQIQEIRDRRKREDYINSLTLSGMKNQINHCFKIQNLILQISDKFSHGNKTANLIQYIFSSLLKTYLFCYSIVSISIKSFIMKSDSMGKYELESLYKLGKYFNKDYTKKFLLFIERNKMIQSFKNIKYNEFISIDDRILDTINLKLIDTEAETYKIPSFISQIPFKTEEELQIQLNEVGQDENETIQSRRIPLKIRQSISFQDENPFQSYNNFYCENFIIKDKPNQGQISQNKSMKSFKLKHKLTFCEQTDQPTLKKDLLINNDWKFHKQSWDRWNNIYSS